MKEFEQIAVKINSKEEYKKSKKLFLKLGYKNDKKWNELYVDKIGGVIKYNLGFESGMFSLQSSCVNFKTFNSIKEFKEYVKSKEPKKGKLTIIVSKNYKDLYEDNLALVNHILLDTVKNDKEWVEKVQKSNLNITIYTDKNDTELFKNSFGKFEVKLMDKEELASGWYNHSLESNKTWLMYYDFESGKRFGFDAYGKWHTDNEAEMYKYCLIKADIKEVEERLKEESIKRRFKEGNFKSLVVNNENDKVLSISEWYFNEYSNTLYSNKLNNGGKVAFKNGVWAEIVEEKLTLKNIQVDCSELTSEQIENMKRVVVENGYELWDDECAFKVSNYGDHFYLSVDVFCILIKMDCLTTITYEKFMELFDTKKEECNNNLKGLVLISHKGVDKSRLQESEYVKQMIKEGKISHAENFNKSLVTDNGSTISNVKEGVAKSIEELHVEHREVFNPQSHYNNEFGSLYKMSEQLGLNTYEFDILKRVVRCRKKGQFEEDLQKTKDLIDLYLIESKK